MQPYRYDIKKFALISAAIAIPANSIFSYFTSAIGQSHIVNIGFATSIVALFWFLFDRYLWRLDLLRTLGISDLPDLNGLWVGEVDRLGENAPHRFEMRIFQTYSKISIQTNTGNSKANSVSALFLTDETMKNFDLVNYWSCRTKRRGSDDGQQEDFKGLSHIDVRMRDGQLALEDYYFTDRNPATQGKTILRRETEHDIIQTNGVLDWFVNWLSRIFKGRSEQSAPERDVLKFQADGDGSNLVDFPNEKKMSEGGSFS